MKISKSKLRRIILEELDIVRYILERKKSDPRWRAWDEPDPKPKRKRRKRKKRTAAPLIIAATPKRSKQLNRQLQYLFIRKNEAGIRENFIIIDDIRHILYVFEPNHFKELKSFPVITGENSGDEVKFNYIDWMKEKGLYEKWSDMKTNIENSQRVVAQLKTFADTQRGRSVGGKLAKKHKAIFMKKHKAYKKYVSDQFDRYLSERAAAGAKITPAGEYTISSIEAHPEDKFNYGIGIFSLKAGADDPAGKYQTWAIHGSGNPGRVKVMKKAQYYLDRGIYNIAPILIKKPSYGCVNLLNKNIKILAGLVRPGSQVYVLPEDGTINKVGSFESFVDRISKWTGQCFDKVSDFFTFD